MVCRFGVPPVLMSRFDVYPSPGAGGVGYVINVQAMTVAETLSLETV